MIYHRPDRGSMDEWAAQVGDDSYNWDNMLPHFKRSVTFIPENPKRAPNATASYDASAFDAGAGPLKVSYPNFASPFSSWLQKAVEQAGIPPIKDMNSGQLLGAQYASTTIDPQKAKRSSSQTSFYDEAKGRKNLKSYTLVRATKILFDDTKRATGVRLSTGVTLNARKEVILSAGAFHSPQLLMLSGIGPAAHLSQFGIPVIADRPGVGQNMTDHMLFVPTWRVSIPTFTALLTNPLKLAEAAANYLFKKAGPLTNPGVDFLAWEKIPRDLLTADAAAAVADVPPSWPDVEYLTGPGYLGDGGLMGLIQPFDGYQYASIVVAPVAPKSRGTVTLKSGSALALPEIDPRWLTHPADVAIAVAAFKRARAIAATPAMTSILADREEYFPGPKVQTDEQILAWIRKNLSMVWHAATTCRMGRGDDPNAVVDAAARVIGVQGLRVVDASSFALLPPGHPQSVVYAFAEKIAADIKAGK